MQESIYKKRKVYYQRDLEDFYEGVRFTMPFLVYRKIEWWYTLDIIAQYSNIFVTGTYAYVAFFLCVNVFNCLNLFLLGFFFFNVTRSVGLRSQVIQKTCSVQSQCDIRMAKLVTKRYKQESFNEFLRYRRTTWNIMFIVLIAGALLQYPTPIIQKIKQMELDKE